MKTADILAEAHVAAKDLDTELVYGFDSNDSDPRLDAIRLGDKVLTMQDPEDIGGEAGDGYAYTWGAVVDGEYEDESDAQWADTAGEALAAVEAWIARVSA